MTISRHLLYLRHEFPGLSFYEDSVTLDEKLKMVEALRKKMDPTSRLPGPARLNAFVTSETKNVFKKLGAPSAFLRLPPESWADDVGYKEGAKLAGHLMVTNDRVKRGVAHIQDFTGRI